MGVAIKVNHPPVSHSGAARTGMLFLFLLLAFSATKYLPGMLVVQDAFTALIFLFLVLINPYLVLTRRSVGRLEFYGLAILTIIPVVCAYMAYVEFGQPYWYGLLAQRELVLIGCSLMFIHLYRKGALSLENVERALLWLAWFSLIAATLANSFLDARQLGNQAGFSSAGMDGDGARLLLDTTFIIYGFFYYAFLGVGTKGKRKYEAYYSLLFLAYLVFIYAGRSALLAVLASYLFFSIKWRAPRATAVLLSKILAAVILVGAFLYFFPSEGLVRLWGKFGDAIQVVVSGQEGNDVSANARILEIGIAKPYVEKNWLLGNGAISNQWNGGFSGALGYFHPSDVGLFGVIYEYGALGLVLFSVQLYFMWRYARYLPNKAGQFCRLINAVKGFLLYFLLNSITTGRYVFLVEQSFFCIALLYCAAQAERAGDKKHD